MLNPQRGPLPSPFTPIPPCQPIPLSRPVPPKVSEALALAAPGWPVSADNAGIRVRESAGRLHVTGDGVDRLAADAWEAAHWILAAAIGAAAEAAPGRFVLNAGAALIAGRAAVFAGESHAGKSSVALHLAAGGLPLLGDDRLILELSRSTSVAVALGLARKIRTPLPSDFSNAARRLATTTRVGHAAGADVLDWDPAIDRPAGTAAPVGRILLLRRDPGLDTARISALRAADAVAALLTLCGRHAGPAATVLETIAALVRQVPVDRLDAPDSSTAAAALAEAFAG